MTRDAPWFKLYCRDWLDATRSLDPALRGIYIDVLCIMYDRDGPVPDDESWMAHQLHVSRRTWRSSRAALVACGKLLVTPMGLVNDRAISEIKSRAKIRRTNAENGAKNSSKYRDFHNNENKNNEPPERPVEPNNSYARAHQNLNPESRTMVSIPTDDGARGVATTSKSIPIGWRQGELEWLRAAVPAKPLQDLVAWLWRLEQEVGPTTITDVMTDVKTYIETGGVPNVMAYVSTAAKNRSGVASNMRRFS